MRRSVFFHLSSRLILGLAVLVLPLLKGHAAGERNFDLASSDYPVRVQCVDAEYGGLVLDILDQSFKYFASRTGIKSFGPMSFRFVLTEKPPRESNLEMETMSYPRRLNLGEDKEYRVNISSRDFNPVALVRTAMTCQLEAFGVKHLEWKADLQIPAAPFWLAEGLTQGMLDKKTPSLEKIIARIHRSGPVPSLETIQSWEEPSPHRVEQWWQEACCYWLVYKATETPAARSTLTTWLDQYFTLQARPFWEKGGEGESWWKTALSQRTRQVTPSIGEAETRQELQKSLLFQATVAGEKTPRDFNLARLPKPPLEFTSAKPFEEVMTKLMRIQARGNFLWQQVIEDYRTAYALWLKGKYADYQKKIADAEGQTAAVEAYAAKTKELLDWYEVNHAAPGPKFSTLLRRSLAFQDAPTLENSDKAEIASRLTTIEKQQ